MVALTYKVSCVNYVIMCIAFSFEIFESMPGKVGKRGRESTCYSCCKRKITTRVFTIRGFHCVM